MTDRTIPVNGIRTHFVDEGDGPALLLIHGLGPGVDGLATWSPVLPALRPHTRTITVDCPGFGGSDMLPVADTPDAIAHHFVALLDALEIQRVAVFGHSRGGRVAIEMYGASPDRVERLGLVCSGSSSPASNLYEGKPTDSASLNVRFGADGDLSFETFVAARRSTTVDPTHMPDAMLGPMYERFMAERADDWLERIRSFDLLGFYRDEHVDRFTARLRAIAVPTLVIAAREDLTAPWERQLTLVDLIPNVELHVFGRSGHAVQLDKPVALAEVMLAFVMRGPEPWDRAAAAG